MSSFHPIREWPKQSALKPGDYLVVIGEVFSRGYVNGLIDEAKKNGLKVILTTVGRREKSEGSPGGPDLLRPLTKEESAHFADSFVNVPLEAGFDLEPDSNGISPVDQLKDAKLKDWQNIKLDWTSISQSQKKGTDSFRSRLSDALAEITKMIPADANVMFAHTMAGGFPRARVIMPIANHVFKGYGDRYSSSKEFWESDLGKLCEKSFLDVTAQTFQHLIDLTENFRNQKKSNGKTVSYVAFGYHGTETYHNGGLKWQSYAPYLQGWAKLKLEAIAEQSHQDGIPCSVYNCPEILTNSTTIFLGVEVCLYPLLEALKDDPKTIKKCQELLKPEHSIAEILRVTTEYLESPTMKLWNQMEHFNQWPKHNGPEQMQLMRTTSETLINFHKDTKNLLTSVLSEVVFRACGRIMFHEGSQPKKPVWWIGHDAVAKVALEK